MNLVGNNFRRIVNPRNIICGSTICWIVGGFYTLVVHPWYITFALMILLGVIGFCQKCPNCRRMVSRNRSGIYTPWVPKHCRHCGIDLTDPASYPTKAKHNGEHNGDSI